MKLPVWVGMEEGLVIIAVNFPVKLMPTIWMSRRQDFCAFTFLFSIISMIKTMLFINLQLHLS